MTQFWIGLGIGIITGVIFENQASIGFGIGVVVGTLGYNYYKHKSLR